MRPMNDGRPATSLLRRTLRAAVSGRRIYACACAAFVLCALTPGATHATNATVPGQWDPVTAPTGGVSDQVALLRDPNGSLHVIWHLNPPGTTTTALMQTMISASGKVGTTQTIVSGWAGIGDAAIMRTSNGRLLLIAGATPPLGQPDPFVGYVEWTSSDDGANWTIAPQSISQGGGFSDPATAALAPDGLTPFEAWVSTDGLFVHRGTDPSTPNANLQAAAGLNCCADNPAIVADDASKSMVLAWWSDASQGTAVYARTVDPVSAAPTGRTLRMPGTLGSPGPGGRVALTAIPGQAGTYVAYPGGGSKRSRILVWKVGSQASTTIGTLANPSVPSHPAIAATPDGRLWVAWSDKGRIWARRSNKARTAWGLTSSVPVAPHTETVFKLAVSAQAGLLDVFGALSPSSTGDTQTWHTQIEAPLSVFARSFTVRLHKRKRQTRVKVKVSDAGDPVAHATVSIGARHAKTSSSGTAVIKLGSLHRAAILRVKAAHAGYLPATTNVRVP